eukprot:1159144-Pelagomonas_calceolata.AAC.12
MSSTHGQGLGFSDTTGLHGLITCHDQGVCHSPTSCKDINKCIQGLFYCAAASAPVPCPAQTAGKEHTKGGVETNGLHVTCHMSQA